jgi:hypothetical protein
MPIEPGSDKRGAKADELHRTPLEPLIPLVNSEFLSVNRPDTALLRARRGFPRGLRALPRGDTWFHGVEMPIRDEGQFKRLSSQYFSMPAVLY